MNRRSSRASNSKILITEDNHNHNNNNNNTLSDSGINSKSTAATRKAAAKSKVESNGDITMNTEPSNQNEGNSNDNNVNSNTSISPIPSAVSALSLLQNRAIIKVQAILRGIRARRIVRSDSLLQAWAELDKAEENELVQTHKQYELLKLEMTKQHAEKYAHIDTISNELLHKDAEMKQEAKHESKQVQSVIQTQQPVHEDMQIEAHTPSSAVSTPTAASDSTVKMDTSSKSRPKRTRSPSPLPSSLDINAIISTKRVRKPSRSPAKETGRVSTPTNDDNKFNTIPDPINLDWVQKLLDYFKSGNKLPTKTLIQLLTRVKPLLEIQPNIVHINVTTRLTVVGDIHGQLIDLLEIFRLQGDPSDRNSFVFNGDFVDRGQKSCECIIILLAFKLLFPNSIHLNRGNHEDICINSRDGFEKECLSKYNNKIFDLFAEIFACLPLITILNNSIFIVHGGLFSKNNVTLNEISKINRFLLSPPQNSIMEEMLWSDPQSNNGRSLNSRGAGLTFGPDVTEKFLKLNKLKLIVRSHECKSEGYSIHHNKKLYTVFSASNYCGTVGNKGAVLVFEPNDNTPRIIQYYAHTKIDWKYRLQSMENSVINKLIPRIADNRLALLHYFRNCETERLASNNTNNKTILTSPRKKTLKIDTSKKPQSIPNTIPHVTRVQWADGLKHILKLNIPFIHLQNQLGLPSLGLDGLEKGPIDYMEFLNRFLPVQIITSNLKRTESDLKLPPELMPGKSLNAEWRLEENKENENQHELSTEQSLRNLLDMLYRNRFDLESLFRHFDVNGDQSISATEFKAGILTLQHIVKTKFNEREVDLLIQHIDSDGDGEISYSEFFTAFRAVDNMLTNNNNSDNNNILVHPAEIHPRKKVMKDTSNTEPDSPPTPLVPSTMDD